MQIKEAALPTWVYTMLEKAYPSDETVMKVMRYPDKVSPRSNHVAASASLCEPYNRTRAPLLSAQSLRGCERCVWVEQPLPFQNNFRYDMNSKQIFNAPPNSVDPLWMAFVRFHTSRVFYQVSLAFPPPV